MGGDVGESQSAAIDQTLWSSVKLSGVGGGGAAWATRTPSSSFLAARSCPVCSIWRASPSRWLISACADTGAGEDHGIDHDKT
jgi:hypothetical protein